MFYKKIMLINQSPFLQTLSGTPQSPVPVWFLRQAGRYLPIYQKFSQLIPNFWDRCFSPDISSEISTFPLQEFPLLDAVIFFSDILVIPKALGQKIEISEGIHVESVNIPEMLENFDLNLFHKNLFPVYQGLTFTRLKIPEDLPLIGFTGGPWTLLTYMIGANHPDRFQATLKYAQEDTERFRIILTQMANIIAHHLINQISMGANVVQIFESWAGAVPQRFIEEWLLNPWQQIIHAVREAYTEIPIILFPRSYPGNMKVFNDLEGVTAIHLSEDMDLQACAKQLKKELVLQGGLHPSLLKQGGEFLKMEIKKILKIMEGRPYVFNLGHGVLPETPVSHVHKCIEWVKNYKNEH